MMHDEAKRLRLVVDDLGGIVELLEALANEGRDDASALRLISREIDGAFVKLEEIAESIESLSVTNAENGARLSL